MISHDDLMTRSVAAGDRMPLLTLDEFFDDNDVEDSIAPNAVDDGRPPLAELAERFRTIAEQDDVAWVRVQVHEECFEDGWDQVSAEAVAVCTSATEQECAAWVDGLESSAPVDGFAYDEDELADVPQVPAGMRVLSIVWD